MFQQNHKEEGQTQQHPPNNTLYINNLNEKIPIDELKEELFNIFEQYGEIVDIVAKRNILMRGQAFIIFKDINSAMEAKQKKSGKQLHGKTLKISFAKEKSDPIAKIEGTFHIRERPADYFQQKFFEKFVIRPQQVKAQKVQRQKNISRKTDKSHNLPNHILFCQGLNGQITKEVLTIHFMKYPGLVDVRLAPKNYAFIEYTDEFKAGTALAALNGFQIGDCALQLSYAKR